MIPTPTTDHVVYRDLARAIRGIVFIGVPHDGMDIEGLKEMAGDSLSRFMIESLSDKNSTILKTLRRNFDNLLDVLEDTEVFCCYETETSCTPSQVKLSTATSRFHHS